MKPPGNDRLNVFGDKTAEFYLNPKSFVEARVAKHKSSVFQQRFLNKPTIWLTDYNMVNSLLHEKCQSYDQGYDVMNILPQLFGSSCVLFQNSDIVIRLREMLARSISGQVEKLNVLLEKTKPALDAMCKAGLAQDVYQTLKVSIPIGIVHIEYLPRRKKKIYSLIFKKTLRIFKVETYQ